MQYEIKAEGDKAVIGLIGEITAPDRVEFEGVCTRVLEAAPNKVVVDLARLQYMDSAGLGFLLILLKMAEEKSAGVVLAAAQGMVAEQLELARFNLLFTITDTV